ncbi:MAG: DUF1566 domain-containing protein, partial [Gammaproteobacteria bacterium]|nr:DUF1566 domain-containing protein [Gammaproteobacteria bacterium]
MKIYTGNDGKTRYPFPCGNAGTKGNNAARIIFCFILLCAAVFSSARAAGPFTDNGDGTVTDAATALMWQQQDDGVTRDWNTAQTYCDGLSLAGYDDWRLPEIGELSTLADSDLYDPAINTAAFPGARSFYYWSGSTYINSPNHAWLMGFNGGSVDTYTKVYARYVRCVRGGSGSFDPLNHLIISSTETVTDTSDGLVWQREDDGATYTWEGASAYCESLVLNEKSDWRLPLVDELKRLIDYGQYNPSSDASIFHGIRSSYYWSDSTSIGFPSAAWHVNFNNGDVTAYNKGNTRYVRCVHGGSGSFDPLNNLIISTAPTGGPEPLEVNFSAGFADGLDPYAYAWDFGDGTMAAAESPVHSYDAGTYTATLTLTDIMGDSLTDSVTITVTPVYPIANFTFTPDNLLPPMYVTFDASGSNDPDGGSITDYAWLIEGQSYSGMTVGHSFSSAGSYQAILTVTDNDGFTGSIQKTVTVLDAGPTAILNLAPSSGEPPLTVTLDGSASSDPDGPIAAYEYLVNGQIKNGATASYTFSALGTYPVVLTVTDSAGQTASQEKTVVVSLNQQPQAVFSDPADGFAPLTVNLDGSASTDPDGSIVAYAWTASDGQNASGSTTSFTFSTPGTYSITLEVTDDSGDTHSQTHEAIVDIKPVYALNLSAGAGGNVSRSPDQADYDAGDNVTVTATANTCYLFSTWSGSAAAACAAGNPVCTLSMDADKNLSANFQQPGYSLTLNTTNGSISAMPTKSGYNCGEAVSLAATPAAGYRFNSWTGDADCVDGQLSMMADIQCQAVFEQNGIPVISNVQVTLSQPQAPATLNMDAGDSSDPDGTAGFVWTVNGQSLSGKTASASLTAAGDYAVLLTATDNDGASVSESFSVTVDPPGGGILAFGVTPANSGQITVNPQKAQYDTNEEVGLTAAPGECYEFDHWAGDCTSDVPVCTLFMDQGKSVTAHFRKKAFPLYINAAHGTVSQAPLSVSYECGSSVKLNAQPETGYRFIAWEGLDRPQDTRSDNEATVFMDAERTLNATFDLAAYSVTLSTTPNVSGVDINVNPVKAAYAGNETLTFTATAAAGSAYRFDHWEGDLSGVQAEATVKIAQDMTVTAVFALIDVLAITPALTETVTGDTVPLSAAGGISEYTWQAPQGGTITPNQGEHVNYTPPAGAGSYSIAVTDAQGASANAEVMVYDALALLPASAEVELSGQHAFAISGGKPPYKADSVTQGQASIAQNTLTYVADAVAGTAGITIKDSLEQARSVQIQVVTISLPVITPAEITLVQRGTAELSVTGGKAPYKWTAQAGNLSADTGDRTAYTAPETAGEYWVRVTDARSQTAEAAVSVILTGSPPVITPATATLFVGETKTFQIAGGKKPYAAIGTLHGQISEQGENLFIYTAPGLAADDTVTITDSLGQKGSAQIETIAINLPDITPAEVTLTQREITELSVTGGKSPYAWTVQAGNLSAGTGDRTAYTAPETTGEYWVRVTDAFNQTAEAAISVIGGSCVITPAAVTLSMGETKKFQIAGGKKPYASISALHGQISEQGEDSFIYTAPGLAADDTVTVIDNLGQKCSAQITVQAIGDLLISPASVHLLSGTRQTVLFKAVNGEEPFAWTAPQGGELQEDGGQAIYTPPTEIGKYPVQVTDGQNFAQAFVSVVNPPKISPTRVMLQVEDLYPFRVTGGEPPYVWTTEKGGFSMHEGVSTKHIAPGDSGVYQITVTDASGHISTAQIAVNDGLQIRPIRALAGLDEPLHFVVSGGVPPYTWSDDSQGAGVEIAHSASGLHEIFVSDSAGHSAAALLETMEAEAAVLLPEETYAKPGETVGFKIEPPGQYVWKADAGSLAGHEGQLVTYAVPEEPGKYYVQVSDGSRMGYTEVLVGLGFIDLDNNVPENAKPVLSRISVDGVPRHERVLEGDQETMWDIAFFMSLPDDGQLYNTHLAIIWTKIAGEIPPLVF